MHVILCVKIAFVFIASAIAAPVTLTAGDSQLENLDKRAAAAPLAIPPVVPNSVRSFICDNPTGASRSLTFPAQSALLPIKLACGTPDKPKVNAGQPFLPLSVSKFIVKDGPFFLTPVSKTNSNTFVIYTKNCLLAGFEANNVNFTPVKPPPRIVGVSVRQRPSARLSSRQEAQIEERAATTGARLKACTPRSF